MKAAVVLLSGGLDSATVLAAAVRRGSPGPVPSRFDTASATHHELAAARSSRRRLASPITSICRHRSADLFGGSALTDPGLAVPHERTDAQMSSGVPITYVPARNTIFLAHALALAEVRGAARSTSASTRSITPATPTADPSTSKRFERVAQLATRRHRGRAGSGSTRHSAQEQSRHHPRGPGPRRGLRRHALVLRPHAEDGAACGSCDACQLRLKGFAEAGAVPDPAPYVRA
jgi:7-cyano-7-deazaguanine synthase